MTLPAIYPIFNFTHESQDIEILKKLLALNTKIVQIRSKIDKRFVNALVEHALTIRKELHSVSKIIINDYLDIASSYPIDGVHLGQTDGDVENAREILGSSKIIGLSCHSIQDLETAPIHALDYLALGPIFESTTKSGHAPVVGLSNLREFVENSILPVVAIGGINQNNYSKVLDTGVDSIALISGLQQETLGEFIEAATEYKNSLIR